MIPGKKEAAAAACTLPRTSFATQRKESKNDFDEASYTCVKSSCFHAQQKATWLPKKCVIVARSSSATSFFKMFNDDGGAKDSGRAKNGKKEWRKDKHGTIPFRLFFLFLGSGRLWARVRA